MDKVARVCDDRWVPEGLLLQVPTNLDNCRSLLEGQPQGVDLQSTFLLPSLPPDGHSLGSPQGLF